MTIHDVAAAVKADVLILIHAVRRRMFPLYSTAVIEVSIEHASSR